jgi:nucleoside-diphosphate-sugar epimerase
MNYLVTGATGFIGQHLIHQLLAEGATVRIFTRGNKTLPASWRNRVQVAQGDLTDSTVLSSAVGGCDSVYHLAGELRDAARMHATNVRGTQNLLAACRGVVSHVVHLSSVGVMGARQPGVVDETALCHPQDAYEQSKYAAEQIALDWSGQTGTPVTVLRPTIVFGEGRLAGEDSMLSWLRTIQAGRFIFFDKRAVANYVYVGDVVAAGVCAAKTKASGVFIVADPCLLSEFVSAAAQALGVPAPARVIPLPVAYCAALVFEMVGLALRRKNLPLNLRRVRALSNRTRFYSERAATTLGWQPSVGYPTGLQRTVNWYRQTKQLAQVG